MHALQPSSGAPARFSAVNAGACPDALAQVKACGTDAVNPTLPIACCRCVAVHPGYGFLSENVDFVEACEARGIAFLGPTADTMRMFSRKHTAREFAAGAHCPILPGAPRAAPAPPKTTDCM